MQYFEIRPEREARSSQPAKVFAPLATGQSSETEITQGIARG
jgi:hypothetical protein